MKLNFVSLAVLLSFAFLASCTSLNAGYEPFDESHRMGYQDVQLGTNENAWMVRFYGNLFTEPTDIVLMAELRAVEICQKRGKPLTRFLNMNDATPSKSIQSVDGFYKFIPPYLKNDVSLKKAANSFEISGGSNDPIYEVTFSCVDKAYSAQLQLREIAPEEAKSIVQDLRGLLQVDGFEAESLNTKNLQVDDFIVKTNLIRVKNKADFYRMADASDGKVKLGIIRDRKNIEVDLQLTDISAAVKTFGQKVVSTACRKEEMKSATICIR